MSTPLALWLILTTAAPSAGIGPEPVASGPPIARRSEAAGLYELGQAAFVAADFAKCVTLLETALESGLRTQPTDVRMIEIRMSLGLCRTEVGRVNEDAAELRRAAAVFQGIVDDAPAFAYDEQDVATANRELDEIASLTAAVAANACPDAPMVRPTAPREDPNELQRSNRRRTVKGGVLIGSGALLVLAGGGLIGYAAAVVPEARDLGVEDQRPWRAYAAIAWGFGIASAALGIGGIVWGAKTLSSRKRVEPRGVALGYRGGGWSLRF